MNAVYILIDMGLTNSRQISFEEAVSIYCERSGQGEDYAKSNLTIEEEEDYGIVFVLEFNEDGSPSEILTMVKPLGADK
jgi:hypothetical protein